MWHTVEFSKIGRAPGHYLAVWAWGNPSNLLASSVLVNSPLRRVVIPSRGDEELAYTTFWVDVTSGRNIPKNDDGPVLLMRNRPIQGLS